MLPWAIGVAWIVKDSEKVVCQGHMHDYGKVSVWVVFGIILANCLIRLPLSLLVLSRMKQHESVVHAKKLLSITKALCYLALVFNWIYSLFAVFDRYSCSNTPLVNLARINAFLPGLIVAALFFRFVILAMGKKEWLRIAEEDPLEAIEMKETKNVTD